MARQRRPYMAARTPTAKKPEETFDAPPHPIGRPSSYSTEIGLQICRRMVEGESLTKICSDPGMACRTTVHLWLTQHQAFRESYKIAQELHTDYWADEAQRIADDRSADYVEKDGKLIPDWELVQRSRLRIDTIKWRCAKMNPKKYSDRYQFSGPDEKPVPIVHAPATDEERVKALGILLERARRQQTDNTE
jgi:hypothetical protein